MSFTARRLSRFLAVSVPGFIFVWLSPTVTWAVDDLYSAVVKPLLAERCFACHGALKQEAGLRVDTAQDMVDSGMVVPQDAEASLLWERVSAQDEAVRMPPEGQPLSDEELGAIRQWIEAGAIAPTDEKREPSPDQHWAFQPPRRLSLPPLLGEESETVHLQANPIDRWLSRKQLEREITPLPSADRRLLLRRLYLDLIGIPPTPLELDAFLNDERKDAYEHVVDQLLASPHYGERWGRHWMDVWRYSDWYGLDGQLRHSQKHIWHWRDWIVESLNQDRGYDEMVRLMLAADELQPQDLSAQRATGFLARNYYLFNRTTWLDDTIEHTSKAFLGLTMNCAKCHDHKYDPITQDDYYRFRSIFEPHHVRLDPPQGDFKTEADGIARVYDQHIDRPTFVHVRGDSSNPDQNHPMLPGAPKFLTSEAWSNNPIKLPAIAHIPALRVDVHSARLAAYEQQLNKEQQALVAAKSNLEQLERIEATAPQLATGVLFETDFRQEHDGGWQIESGSWSFDEAGASQLSTGATEYALRSQFDVPSNFSSTLKFSIRGGDQWKSVGLAFDVSSPDAKSPHQVLTYLSAVSPGSKLQVSYLQEGKSIYPQDSMIALPVHLSQDYTLQVVVRDRLVNVYLNNEPRLAYQLPIDRSPGGLKIVAFDAVANFTRFELQELADDVHLFQPGEALLTPTSVSSKIALAEQAVHVAHTELAAYRTAYEADRALFLTTSNDSLDSNQLQTEASRSFHNWKLAEVKLKQLQLNLELVGTTVPDEDAIGTLSAEAAKQLSQIKEQIAVCQQNVDQPDGNYLQLRGGTKAQDGPDETTETNQARFPETTTGRRTALADWITSPTNPLAARVAVNHIWLRHFGQPLVDNMNDFGRRAESPANLELLDWLAVDLIENDWSMKHLHRLIVTSKAYRRSSQRSLADSQTREADPENDFYWCRPTIRMEAQVIRDSLLAISGKLDRTLGGPSLPPNTEKTSYRRSLYFRHSRDDQDRFLAAFDDADILRCYRRDATVIPQQALALSNSKVGLQAANDLVDNLWPSFGKKDDDSLIRLLYEHCLGTIPSQRESEVCREALSAMIETERIANSQSPRKSAAVRLAHALFNSHDFLTIR